MAFDSLFLLPSKIGNYLRRLEIQYRRDGTETLHDIIMSAQYYVREQVKVHGWEGDVVGHDLVLFLPEFIFEKIRLSEEEDVTNRIKQDLAICAKAIENEFISSVVFELADQRDQEFIKSVPFSDRPEIDPDRISFWQAGFLRVFISHRDHHKISAKVLADALKEYGVSAFVAHDTIEPMSTWQHEITKGLQTMEIMLVFLTDDLHESAWTNQEIGFALGRNIPIITLKLENEDPRGFIGAEQALRGSIRNPMQKVAEIYKLITRELGDKSRLQDMLINAFLEARDFNDAKVRFDRMSSVVKQLTEPQLMDIINGFKGNDQLYNAAYLTNNSQRLANFLDRATNKSIKIEGRKIQAISINIDEEIPF